MYDFVDEPAFWDEIYKTGKINWDTKSPHPVFAEYLDTIESPEKIKILIAGCGKGYDAVLAAKKGFEVTAIDFSAEAIESAKQLLLNERVNIKFLNEDIFVLGEEYNNKFDYVFEYTTYCAINPERRKEFAKKISSLLKSGGRLITVLFPVDEREGGPPFKVDVTEFYKYFSEYLKLELSSRQINSIKPRRGKEILQVYFKFE